jgi:hypothetical protein
MHVNQNIHSMFILILNDFTCSMILTIMFQGTHIFFLINLVPLNSNVTLAVNDELKRPLFPKDDTLLDTVTSGPEGRPNNLQSAWRLAELFFLSDLS